MVERGKNRGGDLVEWPVDVRVVSGVCGVGAGEGWGAAVCGGRTSRPVERESGLWGRGGGVAHLRVGIMRRVWGAVRGSGWGGVRRRVKELGALDMAGYDGDFVRIVEGEVGINKHEKVGNSLREGKRGLEEGPRMGIGVEDDG